MPGVADLHALAHELLSVAAEALDTIPDHDAALLPAPTRQFVSPGAPVWDCCEALAVHVNSIADRFAAPKAIMDKVNTPTLIVTATRCVPEGKMSGKTYKPPTLAELEAAAAQIHADGWALWNHIFNAIQAGTFLEGCLQTSFASMQQVTPSGGCAGWQLAFIVILGGYQEAFGT